MRVLSLCDFTGNILKPWAEAGHECVAVDIAHENTYKKDGITFISADIFDFEIDEPYDLIFAAPPCTDLAISGARWFEQKGLQATIEALQLVERCRLLCETALIGWMIENPVGRLSTAWRKPDYTFNPCDYGDPYTKRTCLWTGGGFCMPPKDPVISVMGSKMHLMSPSKDRQRLRSETPLGFSYAVYDFNRTRI